MIKGREARKQAALHMRTKIIAGCYPQIAVEYDGVTHMCHIVPSDFTTLRHHSGQILECFAVGYAPDFEDLEGSITDQTAFVISDVVPEQFREPWLLSLIAKHTTDPSEMCDATEVERVYFREHDWNKEQECHYLHMRIQQLEAELALAKSLDSPKKFDLVYEIAELEMCL